MRPHPSLLALAIAIGQGPGTALAADSAALVQDVEVRSGQKSFLLSRDAIDSAGVRSLPFQYEDDDQVCLVRLVPEASGDLPSIAPSPDFSVLDSSSGPSGERTFKIRFSDLSTAEFLRMKVVDPAGRVREIPLLPTTETRAGLDTAGVEFFAGQERAIEVLTDRPANVVLPSGWFQAEGFEYRWTETDEKILLRILPSAVGSFDYAIPVRLRKPPLRDGRPGERTVVLRGRFAFRKAGLPFLRIEPSTVLLDERSARDGVEVQMQADRTLSAGRTYVLEEGSAPGGTPVASVWTRERMSDGRILAQLRPFNAHRRSSGSLFLKDADRPVAVANLDVLPKVRIEKVLVMRNGRDWEDNPSVHPGETVHLRLEGQSLDQGRFSFGDPGSSAQDPEMSSENAWECRFTVPLGISRRTIPVMDRGRPTGKSISVHEVQSSRSLDYVTIDHGNGPKPVPSVTGPELHGGAIKDVVLRFLPSKLDSGGKLDGKQRLSLEYKVSGPEGAILEYGTVPGIVVCPEPPSPRAAFYDRSDCTEGPVSLGERLSSVNMWDLEPWSRITLSLTPESGGDDQHQASRRIDIYRQERFWFDVDVSFPVGLLVHRLGDAGWADFSGVSMAMMAKAGLYERGAIAKKEPWEIDAGFIALDAFDLGGSSGERDLGAVALLTLTPLEASRKLSFPIYLGGGYLLSAGRFFWLVGPGISVRF